MTAARPPESAPIETLRDRLGRPGEFVVAAELVPGRGLLGGDRGQRVLELARALAAEPRIDVVSITDNPGGNAMLAPDVLGTDLQARGQEVTIHLSCKDWNRNALESWGWKLGAQGFRNVLALSGDYPVTGHDGLAAPVFDLDSVGLLALLSAMNDGLPDPRDPHARLEATNFFLGCVVTNHKRYEREVVPQYLKLRKKAQAGARFAINQIGWNVRKDDELLRWTRNHGLGLSLLGNVYVLTAGAARVFRSGRIPGVVMSDALAEVVERQAAGPDKGRRFFVELAAKHLAVVRGLGFDGAYLGGHVPAETLVEVLDTAASYADGDWRELSRELHFGFPGEFYAYEEDAATGLASDVETAAYQDSKRRHRAELRVPLSYRLSRRMHGAVFAPEAPLHPVGRAVYAAVDKGPRVVGKALHLVEQSVKVPLFHCQDCGDCSLPEIAYVCPESMCAKNQRNGPCGGTRDGRCEVYDTECIWSQAYERLKAYGEEESMLEGPVVVKDNALAGTSAWANTFLGRDHTAREQA